MDIMSSSRLSSSSIPFSSSQLFSNFPGSSYTGSPGYGSYSASPASLLFAHHNGSFAGSHMAGSHGATPPTPSLLSAFSANTLLTSRRLRLIASMFSQMCEAVSICHDAGVSHRDIKPENFICCDSIELESVAENNLDGDGDDTRQPDFGPQAKRKVVVKLTDFGLATTEYESGDVECGSKPYMSYECRNNLGPTYCPAPADVWSLGIVIINMLFHRNPWKDPTEGDPNFDSFLQDPMSFLQTKFSGIGKEVSTYLATRVLCTEVEDRVTARQFGEWVRNLPEMIAGRRAVRDLKKTRMESRAKQAAGDKGLFVKAPVGQVNPGRSSLFTSALTSSAPLAVATSPSTAMAKLHVHDDPEPTPTLPSLATLPPASELTQGGATLSSAASFANPVPTPDLDCEEVHSATTVDEYPTPSDMSALVSPEPTENGQDHDIIMEETEGKDTKSGDGDDRSTHKRRKRGIRKGKAAQAAAAAAASGVTQDERDSFMAELVQASEELARDLSTKKRFDPARVQDFPPLGTSPAQVAAARKSKWKDFLAVSKGNPQLEALARRVAERDSQTGDTWSAPAKLQQGVNHHHSRHTYLKQTATTSSALSSQLSSIAPTESSSATSSFIGGADDDDWRRTARQRQEERRAREKERETGREKKGKHEDPGHKRSSSRPGMDDSSSRQRQAALAAAAIAGGLEPMGSFGKPSPMGRPVPVPFNNRPAIPGNPHAHRPSPLAHDKSSERWAPPTSSVSISIAATRPAKDKDALRRDDTPKGHRDSTATVTTTATTTSTASPILVKMSASAKSPNGSAHNLPSASSGPSLATLTGNGTGASNGNGNGSPHVAAALLPVDSPKPKLGGLAKMFGGLKTKGRE
jgi:serine/threonine protein kinase